MVTSSMQTISAKLSAKALRDQFLESKAASAKESTLGLESFVKSFLVVLGKAEIIDVTGSVESLKEIAKDIAMMQRDAESHILGSKLAIKRYNALL